MGRNLLGIEYKTKSWNYREGFPGRLLFGTAGPGRDWLTGRIFEWPSLPDSRIILIGIANQLDLTDRSLSRLQTKCELKQKLMHFPPYTKQQIVEIFTKRLEESGVFDLFPPVVGCHSFSPFEGYSIQRSLSIGNRGLKWPTKRWEKVGNWWI